MTTHGPWFGRTVVLEVQDGEGSWHVVEGADALHVFPSSYEVTFTVKPMWARHAAILEGMRFRVDGQVALKALLEGADVSGVLRMMLLI